MNCKGLSRENCIEPCKYVNGEKRKYCKAANAPKQTPVLQPENIPPMVCKGLSQETCLPPCSYVNGKSRKYCKNAPVKGVKSVKSVKVSPLELDGPRVCKGLSQENCVPPCSYVNGKTRKYCKNAPVKGVKSVKSVKSVKVKSLSVNAKAMNKIGKFMLKKRDNITSHFLTSVCADSGVCIAFGKESEKIKTFFDDFSFKYKKNKSELSKGGNGVVYEIEYERLNYKAFTILKTAVKKTSDNLIYEYLVGMLYINTYYKKFPCFLETYNWVDKPTTSTPTFFKTIDRKQLIKISCKSPTSIGIQVEYLKNPFTMMRKLYDLQFLWWDIFQCLFQVYYPLFYLGNTFTHYDLHFQNVLLHEPVKGRYIHYHYHGDTIVSFKSKYITKIIDYGRCYFKTPAVNSLIIRKEVCKDVDCNKPSKCGAGSGYGFLKNPTSVSDHYINSSIPNNSHDLRLLYYVSGAYKDNAEFRFVHKNNPYIDTFLTNIVYNNNFGTKERNDDGFPNSTHNISDAFKFLTAICSSEEFTKRNEFYEDPSKKLGDLHIYNDGRDMEFIPI